MFNTRDVFAESTDQEVRDETVELIPLHQYTFGDVQVTRNQNHAPIGLSPQLDRLFSARALLWGAIPVFRFPDRLGATPPDALRHFRRIARARAHYGNRFVARGELLRSPRIETETVELHGHSGVATVADIIQASAWASDTGEIGVFLMNIAPAEDERTVRYESEDQPYSPVEGETIRYIVRNGTYERVVSSTGAVEVTVESDDVVLLVETPVNDEKLSALERIIEAEQAVNGPTEEEALADAKRALERGDFGTALTRAETVISGSSISGPETLDQNSSSTQTQSTTAVDADGFVFLSGLTALGGYLMTKLWSGDDDT